MTSETSWVSSDTNCTNPSFRKVTTTYYLITRQTTKYSGSTKRGLQNHPRISTLSTKRPNHWSLLSFHNTVEKKYSLQRLNFPPIWVQGNKLRKKLPNRARTHSSTLCSGPFHIYICTTSAVCTAFGPLFPHLCVILISNKTDSSTHTQSVLLLWHV
ncbi:hypothetical protein TSMEX_003584 [Taenia solium]|eukprot:TsM_000253800 transcript=TsM_000253800 gene=TsM_000253800